MTGAIQTTRRPCRFFHGARKISSASEEEMRAAGYAERVTSSNRLSDVEKCMAWRCPGPRLADGRAAIFALAAVFGAMAPVTPTIVGDDCCWATGKAAYADGKRGAAGAAGYQGGGDSGAGADTGGGAAPTPGGGAAGAAPGDTKGSPGSGAAGSVGPADGVRTSRARGTSSGGDDREPSPAGPTSTGPLQPPVAAPRRLDQHAVPSGLTQVGEDLSPAEEAALIAGKWR